MHPDVVDATAFLKKGFSPTRLVPFHGLKEDISFSGLDINAVPPHDFAIRSDLIRVLFRPPAEDSHYYRPESRRLALKVIGQLAADGSCVTIFSPRDECQLDYLAGMKWATPPIVLKSALPFVALMKGVDAVISSGGTMLREAAWLGVPAYSIFQSQTGSVDRYLASIGRLGFVSSVQEFDSLRIKKLRHRKPVLRVDSVAEHLAQEVLGRTRPLAPEQAC
jgi:predicted glycosyltransferase